MTKLSVNINKFALIRNSRGQNNPDILQIATQCIAAGVVGITVHPRPDERHIKQSDLKPLKTYLDSVGKEFNIEGYPSDDFIHHVLEILPTQVTLVPDPPEALTSSFGWDLAANQAFLKKVIAQFRQAGIRTAIFVDPHTTNWTPLVDIRPDRVELFTYDYAHNYSHSPKSAIAPYLAATAAIRPYNIAFNAGHDLSLENLEYFIQNIPDILEVSIGHALVCESVQVGLDETLRRYMNLLIDLPIAMG